MFRVLSLSGYNPNESEFYLLTFWSFEPDKQLFWHLFRLNSFQIVLNSVLQLVPTGMAANLRKRRGVVRCQQQRQAVGCQAGMDQEQVNLDKHDDSVAVLSVRLQSLVLNSSVPTVAGTPVALETEFG